MPEDNFSVSSERSLRTADTTHESGMGITTYGCAACPTTVFKTATGFPGMKIVFLGTLEGEDSIETYGKPEAELWVKYRVPWLPALDSAMQFDEFPLQ